MASVAVLVKKMRILVRMIEGDMEANPFVWSKLPAPAFGSHGACQDFMKAIDASLGRQEDGGVRDSLAKLIPIVRRSDPDDVRQAWDTVLAMQVMES